MALTLDIELSPQQLTQMRELPDIAWFTQVRFRNAESPLHPEAVLSANNTMKQSLVGEWLASEVRGKRVLDLFSANGAFAVAAALAGAREVVGVESDPERVRCANFLASTLPAAARPHFLCGDVYRLSEYFAEPFDLVLCFGGLYHVGDPAHVLSEIRRVTTGRMILQTSQVLPLWGNWARFRIRRRDKRTTGLSSIRGGYGTWWLSPGCLRELIEHSGFGIIEERRPPLWQRARFPWYAALCEAATGAL